MSERSRPFVHLGATSYDIVDTANACRYRDAVLQVLVPALIAVIIGAGKANHLTGTVDAYLRNTLKNGHVRIIGVAFEGENEEDNRAAIGSITHVPGTHVIYHSFFGADGFADACRFAVKGDLGTISVPDKDYFQRRIPWEEVRKMAKGTT